MSVERLMTGSRLRASGTEFPVIWLTGNTGAGKTTLASGVQQYFNESTERDHPLCGRIIVLDGDEMRATISTDETLTAEDRRKHNLRVARLAKHLQSQGFCVIVSVIAPFVSVRQELTAICDPLWIYVKRSDLDAADRPYEPPRDPALVVDNDIYDIGQAQELLRGFMARRSTSVRLEATAAV